MRYKFMKFQYLIIRNKNFYLSGDKINKILLFYN